MRKKNNNNNKIVVYLLIFCIFVLQSCLGSGDYSEYDYSNPSSSPTYQPSSPSPSSSPKSTGTNTNGDYVIKFKEEVALAGNQSFDLVKESGETDYSYQLARTKFLGSDLVVTYSREGTFDLQAVFEPIGDWGRQIFSPTKSQLNCKYQLKGTGLIYVLLINLENEAVVSISIGETTFKHSEVSTKGKSNNNNIMLDNRQYIVQKGDRLSTIAKENNLSVEAIINAPQNANCPFHIRKGNYLVQGEVIYLPVN